jgi:hypothetical protein
MISEHQQVAHDAATIEDIDAIAEAIQLFIDGTARGAALAPAAGGHAARRPAADRRGELPQSRGLAGWTGADHRQRPVGLPDR